MKTLSCVKALHQRVALPILHWISPKIAFIVTHAIARWLPNTEWYRATFRVTRWLSALSGPLADRTRLRADWMLNFWLKHIFVSHRPFPIPMRAVGAEAVFEAKAHCHGVALISVHVPLAHLIARSLIELGCPPDAVVANPHMFRNGRFPVGGSAEDVPGLAAGTGAVLLKARNILRRGGTVAALIDTAMGAPMNSNMLRLVRLVGARLVFALVEVQKDGEILVRYHVPPDPYCRSREGILSNIEFMRVKVSELLQHSSQSKSDCLFDALEESRAD